MAESSTRKQKAKVFFTEIGYLVLLRIIQNISIFSTFDSVYGVGKY